MLASPNSPLHRVCKRPRVARQSSHQPPRETFMLSLKNLLGCGVAAVVCISAHAQAAGLSASCTFANCSAHVAGAASLQVSCDGNSVYNGAYELTTDFKTTQIQAVTPGGPQITIQGVPTSTTPINSTLVIAGKPIAGTCCLDSNQN